MGKGRVFCFVVGLGLSGCGSPQPEAVSGVIGELPEWEFIEEAGFRIGAFESSPGFPFGRIRSVARSATGQIYVADDQAFEVHEFDSSGEHVRSFGRKGDGPGEFDVLSSVHVAESGVATWDPRHARITWWTTDGAVDSIATLANHRGQILIGWDEDTGATVFRRVSGLPSREERRGTYVAEFIPYWVDGDSVPPIVSVPFMEVVRLRGWPEGIGGLAQPVPFGFIGLGVVADGTLHVTDGANPEVSGYALTGSQQFTLALDLVRAPVTDEDRTKWRDEQVRSFGNNAARARPFILAVEEEVGFSEQHPAILAAIPSADGDAWFRTFDRNASAWIVVGSDGAARAKVEFPLGTNPLYVSEEMILALARDALGQQSIVRFVRAR